MEHLTNPKDAPIPNPLKKKIFEGKPVFVTVPENFEMSPKMAAEILKQTTVPSRTDWANFPIFPPNYVPPSAKTPSATPSNVNIVSPEDYQPGKSTDCVIFKPSILPEGKLESFDDLFISKDPLLSGKHSLVITDTSNNVSPSDRRIIIREMDGTLRRASYDERLKEGKRVFGYLVHRKVRRHLPNRPPRKSEIPMN